MPTTRITRPPEILPALLRRGQHQILAIGSVTAKGTPRRSPLSCLTKFAPRFRNYLAAFGQCSCQTEGYGVVFIVERHQHRRGARTSGKTSLGVAA